MNKFFWSVLEIIETVAIAIIAVVVVRTFIVQPFVVSGASMEPSFYNGNYLLIDELTFRFREPERGEVVVFKYPGDNKSFYIKRIIGLPNEKVSIDSGKVRIETNEGKIKILDEPYISTLNNSVFFESKLGEKDYFVLGDNRNFSWDSRSWGSLPKENIVGLVRLRLWPVNEAMAFGIPDYK